MATGNTAATAMVDFAAGSAEMSEIGLDGSSGMAIAIAGLESRLGH